MPVLIDAGPAGGSVGTAGASTGGPPASQSQLLAAAKDAAAYSHQVASRALLLLDKTPAIQIGNILPGGTVTLDTTAEQMRTCSFQFVTDPRQAVPSWLGKLQPNGAEIKLQYGIATASYGMCYFDVGVFGVEEVDTETSTASPGPIFTITGYDRAAQVAASTFTSSRDVVAGKPAHEAVYSIVHGQVPSLSRFNLKPTNVVPFGQQFQSGEDAWLAAVEVAQAAGCVLYFDTAGTLVMKEVPTGQNAKVAWSYTIDGKMTATDIKRTVSADPGYNGIQVTASNSKGKTITTTVWDDNPTSPTYYLGPYGKRPAPPVSLSSVASGPQLAKVAKKLLHSVLGLTRQTTLTAVPAPWLDAYDLVRVRNAATMIDAIEMVTGYTMPLDTGLMSLTTTALSSPPSDYVSAVADLTMNLPASFGMVA